MPRSKGWPTSKLLPSAYQPHCERDGSWTTPPCLGVLGCRDYLPLKDFQRTQNHQVVQCKEMVALAMALQRCAVYFGMSLGMLCRVIQVLCGCPISIIGSGYLIDFEMLDVARMDPLSPTSERSAPLLASGANHWSACSEPTASEPEQAATLEVLALVPRQRPLVVPFCGQMSLAHSHCSRQTGPLAYPWEPNWTVFPWGPYR